jgi:hypothetical protein
MSLPAGTIHIGGIACTPDGAVYVEPTGSASITGGTIADLTSLSLTSGAITSGTYTPTLTNVSNLDGSTAYECQYLRVGNVVTVSGKVDANPTAAASTELGISLPIASNFAANQNCGGSASSTVAEAPAAILADATNDRARMIWVATNTANHDMTFSFTYRII